MNANGSTQSEFTKCSGPADYQSVGITHPRPPTHPSVPTAQVANTGSGGPGPGVGGGDEQTSWSDIINLVPLAPAPPSPPADKSSPRQESAPSSASLGVPHEGARSMERLELNVEQMMAFERSPPLLLGWPRPRETSTVHCLPSSATDRDVALDISLLTVVPPKRDHHLPMSPKGVSHFLTEGLPCEWPTTAKFVHLEDVHPAGPASSHSAAHDRPGTSPVMLNATSMQAANPISTGSMEACAGEMTQPSNPAAQPDGPFTIHGHAIHHQPSATTALSCWVGNPGFGSSWRLFALGMVLGMLGMAAILYAIL